PPPRPPPPPLFPYTTLFRSSHRHTRELAPAALRGTGSADPRRPGVRAGDRFPRSAPPCPHPGGPDHPDDPDPGHGGLRGAPGPPRRPRHFFSGTERQSGGARGHARPVGARSADLG